MKSPLRPGDPRSLGGYELTARLGEGGMGAVFLGRRDDGLQVAVKIIKPEYAHEEEFRGRFRSEVKRARQVPPFCTAAVLDADPEHPTPYLVVEYVDGPSLDEVVAREGPLTGSRLHSVAVGVATALTAIHGAGVIHRDLKPRNVLFDLGAPKVIDFGIARALEVTSQHTQPDQMVGTVAYMAPERFDGVHRDITPAADVFAWGAVIAYAGTGRTPFRADSPVAVAARILTQQPDLTGLTGTLADLVALALSKDPQDRPTAYELLNLLLAQNTDPHAFSRPHTLDPRLREAAEAAQLSGRYASGGGKRLGVPAAAAPVRRHRGRTAVITVTAVATALATGLGLYSGRWGQPVHEPVNNAGSSPPVVEAAMPVPGAVRGPWVVDALDRRGQWKTDGERCTFKDGLVMTSPDFGVVCPGSGQTFAGDQSITASVTVGSAASCAEIQFRSTGAASYWLDLCPQTIRVRHEGALQTTTLATEQSALFERGKSRTVRLVLRDEVASVTVDGTGVLSTKLTDPSLLAGKVAFGVGPADRAASGEELVRAVVRDVEIRPIGADATPPASLAFTDVRKGNTKSIVKVRGYYPKSRSVVVEPVLFMSGGEYCTTFKVKPSSEAPCEREWVTEDSRMIVTLPTSATPKLVSVLDDPQRCAREPDTASTCAISADGFAKRIGETGLAEITTAGGTVTAMTEVYTP